MLDISLATIGFTKTSAERFFERLRSESVSRIIDVRLNNTSQLAGFAKSGDLSFFLKRIVGADYVHEPILAPTQDILDDFKKNKGDWFVYETKFMALMSSRKIEEKFNASAFDGACLLCSEDTPHHCHRRLVCEYLNMKWGGNITVRHL